MAYVVFIASFILPWVEIWVYIAKLQPLQREAGPHGFGCSFAPHPT